ncbi:hypothetical protein ACSBR2_036024 [Camellia fascicularis]
MHCLPLSLLHLTFLIYICRAFLVLHFYALNAGKLLTALICEYLDWAQLGHTQKVYLPECNLQKDSWKAELKEFSSNNGYDLNKNGDSAPFAFGCS